MKMKAAVYRGYGPPEVVRIEEIEKPTPKEHQILVKVRAATVGTWDAEARRFDFPMWFWLPLRLGMGIRTPRWPVLGQELAGEVEAVGKEVSFFKAGDRVFASVGLGFGAHAEYACISTRGTVTHMPSNLSFAEAATIPVGGDNALHFLRLAEVKPGERVLVNGAAGNIGVMAVQIAKHFGAEVTAVDSAEKLGALQELGADHVIDYASTDYTQSGKSYDVIFDLVFHAAYSRALGALSQKGRYIVANPRLHALLRSRLQHRLGGKRMLTQLARSRRDDLVRLKELAEAGEIRGAIDRQFPLEQAAEAHAYVDSGQRAGAVVLTMGEPQ